MQDQSDHWGRFAGVQAADWVMKHLEWFSPNCAARFMEMVTPTNGALMAMLIAAGVPYGRWMKFAALAIALLVLVGIAGMFFV